MFIDGTDVGQHTAGGYTPFDLLAPACGSSGVREVAVIVNNQQNATLSPTFLGGDFYYFSGLIRPVVVLELPSSLFYPYWLARVDPISKDADRGIIDIRVVFGGDWSTVPSVHLAYAFNGAALGLPVEYPIVNGTVIISGVPVPDFKPWTLGQGNLYTLQVTETALQDSITVRSGVRVLGVDPATSRLTINGQKVNLVGFNRHTMWPDTGAAITPAQEAADLALLQQLNANYVRGAHYPQSQSWLDLLDEAGIVLWEEALGPGVSTANTQDPYFMANHLQAVAAMTATSFAHPSVIFHAFFNEGPSNDVNAAPAYAASAQAIRDFTVTAGNPPARLVTWANNKLSSDVCIAYEDVISFNSYPGWYDHPLNISYVPTFWGEQVDWVAANWPYKPMAVSETGGGGVWEWSNDTAPYPGPFWSQQYQKWLVAADASFISNNTRVSGLTLWQFSDIKANDASTAECGQCTYFPHPPSLSTPWNCSYVNVNCGRPKGENNKGIVDFWRRPKEDFDSIASIFAANGGFKP